MCGRYESNYIKQRLAEEFHLRNLQEMDELCPNYNIAPTTMQPVIVENRDTGEYRSPLTSNQTMFAGSPA